MAGGKQEVVRLRVSQGGKFVMTEKAVWKYVGGDTFMHTVPASWQYAELMFSLAEKVDGAVSVKYQLPGEELDPDSLISVSDDSDLQELFDEYARALRMPGTPVKTFRMRVFLFRAAEDPLTPEDIVAGDRYLSSRASSIDKLGKESGFSKALSKAATNSYASNYSSGSSSANVTSSQAGGPAASVETETELAWEAGFRAGQEAMAMAAAEAVATEEEWEHLMSRRMVNLARMQSHYMLGEADEAVPWGGQDAVDYTWAMEHLPAPPGGLATAGSAHAAHGAAQHGRYLHPPHPSQHQHRHTSGSGRAASSGSHHYQQLLAAGASAARHAHTGPATGMPEGLLGDFPVDMDASLVDLGDAAGLGPVGDDRGMLGNPSLAASGFLTASGGWVTPPGSPGAGRVTGPPGGRSLPGSRLASPRASNPGSRLHSPRQQPPLGSPIAPLRASATAGLITSPRQQQQPQPAMLPQRQLPQHLGSPQPGNLEQQPSVHMEDVPSAEFEAMFESKYSQPEVSTENSGTQLAVRAGRLSAGGQLDQSKATPSGGRLSPNSLLPTHISAFGDGVDLAQAAVAVSPVAACLPTHISEFGEEDGDEPLERDPNAMSVMKAALPEEDLMQASPAAGASGSAMAAMAQVSRLPPGSLQLPTTFELLAAAGGDRPPRTSPVVAPGGLLQQDQMLADDGGLPAEPSSVQRSPSIEELLRKVETVDAQQVRVLAKIGEGAFGEVSLAECPTYGRVAVKWIKPTKVERHWASFWHEAELMSRLNHPNVLRFYGLVVKGPLVVGIMTEFAKNGSLASYLRSGIGFVPLRLRAELALHAVHGMAYLHAQKVVHFDVKPDNLLVDGDFFLGACPVVKVADFGLSKHKYNTFCSNVHDLRGTLPYMAPEMIMDHQHVTEKADVWSLGVVFWEMLTLEVPYQDMPPAQLIGALGLGKLRLPIPEWCEPEWRALMESCWVVDPVLRPSCRQLAVQLERIRDLAPL
ncbi:hypothetical protein N2152v2_003663 [Parachlorella kessleri]